MFAPVRFKDHAVISSERADPSRTGLNVNDRKSGEELLGILKNGNIKTVFQPIISLRNGELLGYEALSRGPENSSFKNPEKMFEFAKVFGRLWELEFLCRIKALENISKYNPEFLIFLNVDPHIINDDKFKKGFTKEFVQDFNINPESIVFEITERNSVVDLASFKSILDNYRDQGYKIAIDDAGSGYSGLKLITEIHPHYIKLDMNLIRDIDKDGLKYALIKTFYDFCQVTDIKLIAEGIETENELNTLIEIGIGFGQGYYIQRPDSELKKINEDLIDHIISRNNLRRELYLSKPMTVFAGDICRKSLVVDTEATGSEILDIFSKNPSLHGIPVVDGGKLAGLIMKDKFYARLGTQYGFALYSNRPVSILMDNRPLTVDYETTIDTVSKMSMVRNDENLYDYVIVNKDSYYYGILTIKDLLEKTTELEVNYARHLNPLSGLPGNMLIEQKLNAVIRNNKPYTILYIDINNFKAYNDAYGFENGDRVLQAFAELLTGCVAAHCQCSNFIGHIGGDDFVIIVEAYEVETLCEIIIADFEKRTPGFYTAEDLEKGGIPIVNRYGNEEYFGFMGISIAVVSNREKSFKDVFELSEYSSRIKRRCKNQKTSCYLLE